jgi:hypothetical protein
MASLLSRRTWTRRAPSMTWKLVTTCPVASQRKPEPAPWRTSRVPKKPATAFSVKMYTTDGAAALKMEMVVFSNSARLPRGVISRVWPAMRRFSSAPRFQKKKIAATVNAMTMRNVVRLIRGMLNGSYFQKSHQDKPNLAFFQASSL